MLNKELLLATESQPSGHVKLTVGNNRRTFGYRNDGGRYNCGSVSKVPTWNLQSRPIAMTGLYHSSGYTYLVYSSGEQHVDASNITVTVVEKGLTQKLSLIIDPSFTRYELYTEGLKQIFDSSDVGKTFTIVFDPEPTGYV